jgi:hypothetical protein
MTSVPDIFRNWSAIWWHVWKNPGCPVTTVMPITSLAASEHGKLRRKQGYSSDMLIHESRILQVTIFGTLHQNLSTLDFDLLLPDVMIIADEVDAQLTQTMDAFAA